MSLPLVSIIVPFLNVEEFIKETIESVLAQEYQNWQLILIDDGSTDNSTIIAKDYSNRFPDKVLYLEHYGHLNKGVCASRNLGIKKAKGELVAFLDSDDVWKREKLSEQIALVKKYPQVSMFCESSIYWKTWEQGEDVDTTVQVGVETDKIYQPPYLALNLYPFKKKASAPCPSSILIKKSAMKEIGGFEESFVGRVAFIEDQAFLFKAYLHLPVYVSSACNNYYRLRRKSAMEVAREKRRYKRYGQYVFFKWAKSYAKAKKINLKELDEALKNAIRKYKPRLLHQAWEKLTITLEKARVLFVPNR